MPGGELPCSLEAEEGAHRGVVGGSPGGLGEGPSRLGLNCSHSLWLGCGIETFCSGANCWLWRWILLLAPGEMEIPGRADTGGRREVWTAWETLFADPTRGCVQVKGQPTTWASLLQGCNRPAACCSTQRLRPSPPQPPTKVFPVQPHVHPGTHRGGPQTLAALKHFGSKLWVDEALAGARMGPQAGGHPDLGQRKE